MNAPAVALPASPVRVAAGAVVIFTAGLLALALLAAAVSRTPAEQPVPGTLDSAGIPAAYVSWVLRAGSLCPAFSPPVIAAQDDVESGWNPHARSPSGAEGVAQFLPSVFPTWGRNDDDTGNVSPFNPRDAIMAQGRFDCALAELAQRLIDAGQAHGTVSDLALAAYNAGPTQVEQAHGVPPDAVGYVQSVDALASSKYSIVPAGGDTAELTAVAAAETALGTPYQWGGSCENPHGPNPAGWCDCSSLVQMAWSTAGIYLPRTTFEQRHAGTQVASVGQLRPGDLVFIPGSDGTAANPGHVGMYVGHGMLIDAPQSGQLVHFTPLAPWIPQVVALRHIG